MYNSQYYTCEQIDQRLLQGYLDDYNSQNDTNLTKEQFLTLLFNTIGRNSTVDNLVTQIGYYECDTEGATAAKEITVANYALFAGGSMKVKFANKNTVDNATLNINSQGAKALYYQGERASSTNSWDEGEVVEIYYDGTSYYANNVKGGSGSGVYDVSVEHPNSGPNGDGKFTLEYILNSNNVDELIQVNKRYPGMSIQFVSISDNKYVQYRLTADEFSTDVNDWEKVGKGDVSKEDLENGNIVPLMAETLEAWADQKAIATPDTYTDAVRTTGGDIPIETSAGSKLESIKPVAGSKWTAKLLFNGSYNMLNATTWGAEHSQPYVGGVGSNFVYFLVPELTLGTFGTADKNNGLLFTDSEGENVQPTSVYFKPLGATVPQSLTDGTSITPTNVSYDGKTYKDYATDGAGWLIIPKTYYDNDVCAHIAWEDWYDKYVSLGEPTTNPEAVVGTLILDGLLALAHSDKYLRGVTDEVCDNVVFGDTSATVTHMVDEISVAANVWTNAATGESDSHGNALYRHSATVSGIKQGGAACVEGEDGGIPLTVNGTTVSYVDTNATISEAKTVFYQIPTTVVVEKAYSDAVFSGSNINQETGVLPINDCSIEAQVAMDGNANITVKYAKNIVDQVAINATVDVPQIKEQVEEHEERITELEDTAVRTGSYDASVAVGLADNFKGDTIVDAEFYKRKTGGTQSVGSGIAAIKEVRGKSIVWNQLVKNGNFANGTANWYAESNVTFTVSDGIAHITKNTSYNNGIFQSVRYLANHKVFISMQAYCETSTTVKAILTGSLETRKTLNAGKWETVSGIISANANKRQLYICEEGTTGHEVLVKNVIFIDLTLMFGAGKEPATVAEFTKMFPLDYYDYNAGEIIPFAGQNLVTTGFNLFNQDAFFAGKSGITKEGDYFVGNSVSFTNARWFFDNRIFKFDGRFTISLDCITPAQGSLFLNIYYSDGTFGGYLWLNNGHNTFTTASGKVVSVIGFSYSSNYNNIKIGNICVSFQSDKDGTYEPYEKHTLPLDPSQWRDKQTGNLVFPYGGMQGKGTAYDYAKVDADGYIRKVVRVFERVDFGNENWSYVPSLNRSIFRISIPNIGSQGTVKTNTTLYSLQNRGDTMVDKTIQFNTETTLSVCNNDYSNVADFKAAMQGIYLIYGLKTPVEVELATPVYAKYICDKDGTEEITPANGTTPYTTMANLSILYTMDARGEIKNLPKNYLSKESAENMLNAMVSAGVIASYTMTYDAANARYQFTIVAPTQSNE